MKILVRSVLLLAVAYLIVCTGMWLFARMHRPAIAHQRPYKWDQFAIPKLQFMQEPFSNVFKTVNEAVKQASHGRIQQVVLFDDSPVRVNKFASNKVIELEMDSLILEFRAHEKERASKGTDWYGNGSYTGSMGGGHSLGCTLQVLISGSDLGYEEREDGIHIWREPRFMECRAYRITEGLTSLMEAKRRANDLHVDAEPIISAFIQATSITSWGFNVPDGPDSSHGESRFKKVFRHLKDSGLILALATPEEHKQAESKLKSAGLWVDVNASTPVCEQQ